MKELFKKKKPKSVGKIDFVHVVVINKMENLKFKREANSIPYLSNLSFVSLVRIT